MAQNQISVNIIYMQVNRFSFLIVFIFKSRDQRKFRSHGSHGELLQYILPGFFDAEI